MTSLQTICAIATQNNWPIHQMDMDVAYLNAKLEDPIYMRKPPGYFEKEKEHVLLLKKCIYGLKQSGREWYKCLSRVLFSIGFNKSSSDAAVFYRHGAKGYVIIGAAMDDLTIMAEDEYTIYGIKRDLEHIFKMKDLGELHWLLNLKIECDRMAGTISFSQEAYIDKILANFNLTNAKTHTTPLDPNTKLNKDQCPTTDEEKRTMEKVPYRQAIGSLMWAVLRSGKIMISGGPNCLFTYI